MRAPLLFLLLFVFLPVFTATAQERIIIKRAGEMKGSSFNDREMRLLRTNVALKTPDFDITCDSAYQFLNRNEIYAYGNIEIETGQERVWADTAYYQIADDYSLLRGRVVLKDDSLTLFGSRIQYFFENKQAYFPKRILLEDQNGKLSSREGRYWENTDSVSFTRQVQVFDSLRYIESDTLRGNRSAQRYFFYGNVFVDDTENNVTIAGNRMYADSAGLRKIDGNAWLRKISDDKRDTTFITAEHIKMVEHKSDSAYDIHAWQQVRIWSPNYSAFADSIFYDDRNEVFQLYKNPRVWHNDIQLTAPEIEVGMRNDTLEWLEAYPSPFIVQKDSALNRLNQIKGDSLYANFQDNELQRLRIYPRSELFYFTKDDDDQPDGAIHMKAKTLRLFFKEDEIEKMKADESVDGNYNPESEQLSKQRLNGFVWEPDLRPGRPDYTPQRRWPDSLRHAPVAIPPKFKQFLEAGK